MFRAAFATLVVMVIGSIAAAQEDSRFLGKGLSAWNQQLQATDQQDRHEAAWALAQLGRVAHGELGAAMRSADPVVRYWAVMGLGRIAPSKEYGITREIVLAPLRTTLNDKAAAPRIAAADQLARLGEVDEAMPILIAGLEDPQESVGVQAAAALVALGKQAAPARAKLEVAAENGGEYVKRLATKALASLQE